ncbi:c-type cytochrome [Cupriavidus plantarum]|uniref:c-type cytochrome n=1 Tax=Cupriavidus plantarum TaxID=942865 RepID=UPI000E228AF3|nr:c-type cytochrome [Cupriavidus plantarum]NYH98525.1 cytochrome c [Cupriavidus plantarum]REF01454.1 cytochrome c [Cupriavidus plantarum]RLK45680.1 cytochrome c [Cupriavidus plantarum]
MTKTFFPLALMSLAVIGAGQPAHASEALAQKYACIGCHQANARLVGPSWQEVAAKYKGTPNNVQQLVASIKAGGSGKWGAVPMPPQPQVPDADVTALAKWILSQK